MVQPVQAEITLAQTKLVSKLLLINIKSWHYYSLTSKTLENTGALIKGSGNTMSSLLNVNPQVNADVNALNTVEQQATAVTRGISSSENNIGGRQIRKKIPEEELYVDS